MVGPLTDQKLIARKITKMNIELATKVERIARIIHGDDNVKIIAIGNPSTWKVAVLTGKHTVKPVNYFDDIRGDSQDLIEYFNKSGFKVGIASGKVTIEEMATGVKRYTVPDGSQVATAICFLFIEYFGESELGATKEK